ncbi:hypothetical protein G3480_20125 [Thiorhodococcus mannitoliphagus]|uniref:Uncharacterized protein n=1 Tax=Thiorhodococcus mannitoliphagus TaxID=329406 RepID=A0A6P1E3I1_9GAMM|nr:hypothetical protein [Thiorhodococcus mannitoliphagus]NEX22584.1 hypothetical protein [Thiorhodococcus mannitoliphagus]
MKIPGATIARPVPTAIEQYRDAVPQVGPKSYEPDVDPVVRRPVTGVEQDAVIYLRDRYPTFAQSTQAHRYGERAVATYESIQQLKHRDDLRALSGVDTFA